MDVTTACMAGEEAYRQWDSGRLCGRALGRRKTPFGDSGEFFLIDNAAAPFYLLPRHGAGLAKTSLGRVNHLANLYALKDLGVQRVLAFSAAGAITHNLRVGDLVVVDDLLDQTYLRDKTFFADSPLGFVRQFPVFCPSLRQGAAGVLSELRLPFHARGTVAVTEGPRLETPAEVRALSAAGAEVVTHAFVPEVFLAKELELCYAAVCYVVNYAETGSRHRPYVTGSLFGGLAQRSEVSRACLSAGAMGEIVGRIAAMAGGTYVSDSAPLLEAQGLLPGDATGSVATASATRAASATALGACDCSRTMDFNRAQYNLPADWRKWF